MAPYYENNLKKSTLNLNKFIKSLPELISKFIRFHKNFMLRFFKDDQAVAEILRVGTSAGGARAKAIVAWNPTTNEVRSGQVNLRDGFEAWLIKFDGVGDPLPIPCGAVNR